MGERLNKIALRGGIYLTAGVAVQAVVGVLASILLARLVGPDAFGRFAAAFSVVGLTMTLITLRLSVLITRASDDDLAGDLARLYSSVLFMETILAALLASIWVAWAGLAAGWVLAMIAAQALNHWTSVNKAFFERSMRYKRLAAAETAAIVLGHLGAIAAAAIGFGEASLYLREVLTSVLLFLVLASAGALTYHRLRAPSLADLGRVFRDARPVWLDGLLEGSFQRLTTLAAYTLTAERDTGYFFMAQSLVMRPHQLVAPIVLRVASNWFRWIEAPAARRRARDSLLMFSGIPLLALAFSLIVLADSVIPLVLGEQWRGAVSVIRFMSAVIVFLTLFEIMRGYALIVREEQDILVARFFQYLSFAAVLLATFWWSISWIDAVGLAVSSSFVAAFFALWLRQQWRGSA